MNTLQGYVRPSDEDITLTLSDLAARWKISISRLHRILHEGFQFPKPIVLPHAALRWRLSDIKSFEERYWDAEVLLANKKKRISAELDREKGGNAGGGNPHLPPEGSENLLTPDRRKRGRPRMEREAG